MIKPLNFYRFDMKSIYVIVFAILLGIAGCQSQIKKERQKHCDDLDQFRSSITTLVGKVDIVENTVFLTHIKDLSTTKSDWKSISILPCNNIVKDAIIQNKEYTLVLKDEALNGLWVLITGKLDTLSIKQNPPQFLTNSVIILNQEDMKKYEDDL